MLDQNRLTTTHMLKYQAPIIKHHDIMISMMPVAQVTIFVQVGPVRKGVEIPDNDKDMISNNKI